MKPSEESEDRGYSLHCQQGEPSSLVILYDLKKVARKYKQEKENIFLWITENTGNEFKIQARQLAKRVNATIEVFQNITEAKKYLNQISSKQIFVIASPSSHSSLQHQLAKLKIVANELIPYQPQKNLQLEANLLQALKRVTENKKKSAKGYQFPNFIDLETQIWNSNIFVKTIISMVNYPCTDQSSEPTKRLRAQLIEQMKNFCEEVEDQQNKGGSANLTDQLDQFFRELKQGEIDPILWYTNQDFNVYIKINTLLKSCSHPAEIFYIQPYFKELFKKIRSNYHELRQQQRNLTCYRGGYISSSQAKLFEQNKGNTIQNLSFLSTSRKKSVAQGFVGNTFFEIKVADKKKSRHGYDVIKVSQFSQQQQVLFNPLNCFQIEEMTIIQSNDINISKPIKYYLRLTLVDLEEFSSTLSQMQEKQWGNIRCQGDVLAGVDENLELAGIYWEEYFRVAEKSKNLVDIVDGLINWALTQYNCTNYQTAEEILLRCNKYWRSGSTDPKISNNLKFPINIDQQKSVQSYEQTINKALAELGTLATNKIEQSQKPKKKQFSLLYLQYLRKLAAVYFRQLRYGQALKQLLKCLERRLFLEIDDLLGVLVMAGNIYRQRPDYDYGMTLKIYQACERKSKKQYGDEHPITLNIKNNLASLYFSQDDPKESFRIHQECLKIKQRILGQNHHSYLKTLSNIALNHKELGQIQQALKIYNKALELAEINFGIYHRDCINVETAIAEIYCIKKNYDQSIDIYERALEKLKKEGKNKSDYLRILHCLANTHLRKGNIKTTRQIIEKCWEMLKQLNDKMHIRQEIHLQNTIAECQQSSNKLQTAVQSYEKIKRKIEKQFGKDKDYIMTLCNLARNYQRIYDKEFQGRQVTLQTYIKKLRNVLDLYKQSIQLMKKKSISSQFCNYVRAMQSTVRIWSKISGFYFQLRNYQESLNSIQESIKAVDSLAESHTEKKELELTKVFILLQASQSYRLLKTSTKHQKIESLKKAKNYINKALLILKNQPNPPLQDRIKILLNLVNIERELWSINQTDLREQGLPEYEDNYEISLVYNDIGITYKLYGDYNKLILQCPEAIYLPYYQISKDHLQSALQIQESPAHQSRFEKVLTIANIGIVEIQLKNYESSQERLQQALTLCQSYLQSQKSQDTKRRLKQTEANILYNFGIIYNYFKCYDRQKSVLKKSLRCYMKLFEVDSSHLLKVMNNLCRIQEDSDKRRVLLRRMLQTTNKFYGANGLQSAVSNLNLGDFYMNEARFNQALRYIEKALAVFVRFGLGKVQPVLNQQQNIEKVKVQPFFHNQYQRARKLLKMQKQTQKRKLEKRVRRDRQNFIGISQLSR